MKGSISIEKHLNEYLVQEGSNQKNDYLRLCKKISHLIITSDNFSEISYLTGLLSLCVAGEIDSQGNKKIGLIKSLISRRK